MAMMGIATWVFYIIDSFIFQDLIGFFVSNSWKWMVLVSLKWKSPCPTEPYFHIPEVFPHLSSPFPPDLGGETSDCKGNQRIRGIEPAGGAMNSLGLVAMRLGDTQKS